MKNTRSFLMVLFVLLLSCNKDDVTKDQDTLDTIIGKWTQSSFSTIENGIKTEEQLSQCERMSELVFSSNGAISSISYSDEMEGCEIEDEAEGTWQKLADGTYETILSGETVNDGISVSGDVLTIRYENEEEQIIFITVLQKKN